MNESSKQASSPRSHPPSSRPRPKELFRRLDAWTRQAFDSTPGPAVFDHVASTLVAGPGANLGVLAARVRVEEAEGGARGELGAGEFRIEAFRRVFRFEFELDPSVTEEAAELLLSTLHSVLAMRVVERSIDSTLREAAEIQRSLLREFPPDLEGFDIAVRCVPTEAVGGDLYDFLELDEDTIGLAVGDASGHGLPAALLVRDIVVGLRMGMEKEQRPDHTLTRLNRVIHASSLSSCFVSLLYAELEQNGNFFYFNAGHERPLLFGASGCVELAGGDTVIGPLAEARFKRRFAHIDHGSTLLVYTDGLLERRNSAGELFGVERLTRLVAQHLDSPSRTILDEVFSAVDAFGGSASWEDDATLLVVRRLTSTD